MTTRLTVRGRLLAAATDTDTRTIRGLLLPYGEPGYTNLGKLTAAKGAVQVPDLQELLPLNLGHDDNQPVALWQDVTETDDGLQASWTVPATPNGDRLLAEVAAGLRTGLSVELDDVVTRSGTLVSSRLTAAGAVVEPAFSTARLAASRAPVPDTGQLEADHNYDTETVSTETYTDDAGVTYTVTTTRRGSERSETTTDDGGDQADATTTAGEDTTTVGDTTAAAAAAAPNDLHAQAGQRARAGALVSMETTARDLFQLFASAYANLGTGAAGRARLLAALSDITPPMVPGVEIPAYVGELWSGVPYTRRIVPLFNHADLTSDKVSGWRWVTKPSMAAYAGNKAPVPSGAVSTEPVEVTAERLAGAHDIDRKFRDFGNAAFFESYFRAMAESYARLSDQAVLTDVVAAAQPVTLGTVPSGIDAGWAAVVDAALQVVDTGSPTFAIVHKGLYRSMLLTPKDQVLEYLTASLGLEEGSLGGFRLLPDASVLTDGQVLVGAKQAATVHELSTVPIRVEALDVANGGVDAGAFGYYAVNVHDDDALALADVTPAVP